MWCCVAGVPRRAPRLSKPSSLSPVSEEKTSGATPLSRPASAAGVITTPTRRLPETKSKRSKIDLDAPSILNGRHETDSQRARPYSPPAAYTPPDSPSPPQSPDAVGLGHSTDVRQPSAKRRKLRDDSIVKTPRKYGDDLGSSQSPILTPSHKKTPGLRTPRSAGKYKRTLDVSYPEDRDESEPGLNNTASPVRDSGSSRSTLMDKFEATYQDLTRVPGQTGTQDEIEEDSIFDSLQTTNSQAHEYSTGLNSEHVLLYPPVGSPYVSVTGTDGSRVYLKLRPAAKYGGRGQKHDSKRTPLPHAQLLTVPFDVLRNFVEEEVGRK